MNDSTKADENKIAYKELLDKFLKTPVEDLEKIQAVIAARPPNWSPTSNAPYYNERYGKQAKILIDKLFANRKSDIVLDAKTHRIAVATLKAQFYQGWSWLCDHAPEKDAREFYSKIKEAKLIELMVMGPRIRIFIRDDSAQELVASMEEVASINTTAWRDEFSEWIDKSDKEEGEIYELKDHKLTAEQLEWVNNSLAGLEGYHILATKNNTLKVAYCTLPMGD